MAEQVLPFQPTEIEVELITAKSAGTGGCHDRRHSEIPLKGQKPGKDKPGFPLQKSPDKENPVTVNCQILSQKLLHETSAENVSKDRLTGTKIDVNQSHFFT